MGHARRWPLTIVAVLVAAWPAWAAVARHRRTAALARLRAAGGTTDVADLMAGPVPPERNAAVLYQAAAAALPADIRSPSDGPTFFTVPPYPPPWLAVADAELAACPRSLALVR